MGAHAQSVDDRDARICGNGLFGDNAPFQLARVVGEGRWSNNDNPALTIIRADEGFAISGEAFWPERPGTHDYPSVHIGVIEGPLTVFGNRARFDDGHCVVDFTLLGDMLVASGNRRCGGMNVSFSTVYSRG